MKVLQILNGDGTGGAFTGSGLAGDTLIWREALMDGPVQEYEDAEEFLQQRDVFIREVWGIDNYLGKFGPEMRKLLTVDAYDEIVMWFEYDLFCQVNLLFLLNWFHQHPPAGRLSLICPGSHPEVVPFYGLGQLTPAQLAGLYPARETVSAETLAAGAAVWQAYAGGDPMALQARITQPLPGLPHLQAAMLAHLGRFPAIADGLNRIERGILALLAPGDRSLGELFAAFQAQDPTYGMGDSQFFDRLQALSPHWVTVTDGQACLTPAGRDLLAGTGDRTQAGYPERWLGGCQLSATHIPFRWNRETAKLSPASALE